MAVLGIVPAEERSTERLGLALIPEPSGKRGMVLQGFELSLGKRVVIRHLRPAQRAGHAEVSEKLSGALARHWSSPIRVQGQDPGLDAMLQAALLDQPAGQGRVLPVRHHPAHDVAAVDVHDDVEVVIAPLLRPEQPRDIPGPHLVRRRGHQLGLLVLGMGALRPAFLNRAPRRPEHDTSCVRCTGRPLRRAAWPPPRRVSGPRTAPNTACRRPRLVPSRSMPGRASGGAAVARLMGLDDGTTSIGRPRGPRTRGFTPTCLASSSAAFKSLSRRRGLSPAAPQLFPARR